MGSMGSCKRGHRDSPRSSISDEETEGSGRLVKRRTEAGKRETAVTTHKDKPLIQNQRASIENVCGFEAGNKHTLQHSSRHTRSTE